MSWVFSPYPRGTLLSLHLPASCHSLVLASLLFSHLSHNRWFYISMKNQGTTEEIKHDSSAQGWLNSLSMTVSIPSILLQTPFPCPPWRKQSHRVPRPCSLCPPCWTRGLVLCSAIEKLLCLFFLSWTPTILPNLYFESYLWSHYTQHAEDKAQSSLLLPQTHPITWLYLSQRFTTLPWFNSRSKELSWTPPVP